MNQTQRRLKSPATLLRHKRSQRSASSAVRLVRVWLEALETRDLLSAAFDITGLTALRADPIYSTITGKDVGIAILDTGLYASHAALNQNVTAWFDAVQNKALPGVGAAPLTQAFDPNGHGTHVSGTAASSNPDIGVAYGAKIIGVRALPDNDRGESVPSNIGDTVVNALNWVYYNAEQYNIRVVNMSLGDRSYYNSYLSKFDFNEEKQAIDRLEAIGVTVVTASGNGYGEYASLGVSAPAVYSTISVANTWAEGWDPRDGASFYGGVRGNRFYAEEFVLSAGPDRLSASSQRSTLSNQLAAPGTNIYSTWNGSQGLFYNTEDGTSMAAPFVSGAVGLMQDVARTFGGHYLADPQQVLQILRDTADTIIDSNNPYNARYDTWTRTTSDLPETGQSFKRINVYNAVKRVRELVTNPSVQASNELNSTMQRAVPLGDVDGSRVVKDSGRIGRDGLNIIGANDVDLYSFDLKTYGVINIKLEKPANEANFGAALRLFNQNGTSMSLAVANGSTYPLIYSPPESPLAPGRYYIGVSSSANTAYTTAGTGAANGQSQGAYDLVVTLSLTDLDGVPIAANDLNQSLPLNYYEDVDLGWITDFKVTERLGSDPIAGSTTNARRTVTSDVDFYKVTVPDSGTLRIDTRAREIYGSSTYDTYLLIYNEDYQLIAYNDDKSLFNRDSKVDLSVTIGQTVYIAVTAYANRNTSPTDPRVGRTANATASDGFYDLHIYYTNGDVNGTAQSTLNRSPSSFDNAYIGTLGADYGVPLLGSGGGYKDVDFFRYVPAADGYFMVGASGVDGLKPVVTVWQYDPGANDIVRRASMVANDDTSDLRSFVYYAQANESLFVSVTSQGNEDFLWSIPGTGSGGQTGTFVMASTMLPLSAWNVLNDNSVDQGQPKVIERGKAIAGFLGTDTITPTGQSIETIIGNDDVDLHVFTATVTQDIRVRTFTSDADSADTVLRVFDATGALLAENDNRPGYPTTDSEITLHVVAGQTYYIGVSGAGEDATDYDPIDGLVVGSGSTGSYSLLVSEVPPAVSIADATINESDGSVSLTLSLSGTVYADVTVQFATANGTALAGQDYTATTGTLTILAGQSSGTIVVPILNDSFSENAETFVVNLSNPTNATIDDGQATVTIAMNDLPALSIGDLSVQENAGTALLTVSLSQVAPFAVTVQYSTASGSALAGQDYTTTTGTLTIPAGQSSGTISVPLINDSASENAESFMINLTNPSNATLADDQATITIPINDFPGLTISDITVDESSGNAVLTVSLSQAAPYVITVSYSTASNTAVADQDFTTTSGTLTIPAGQSSGTITVPLIDDSLSENTESFAVNLTSPTNATLADGQAFVTIPMNDLPTLSIGDVTVDEAAGNALLTVSLSQITPFDISFQVSTSNGSAQSGSDFTAVAGPLTVQAGQSSVSFYVPLLNDTQPENDETFFVLIASPTNATIADGQATVTIPLNDPPTVSIADLTVKENAGPALLTVSLSQAVPFAVTVNFTTSNGTALSTGDYATTSGTLTIPASTASATISIPLIDDDIYEPTETFSVTLSSPTHATIQDAQATATISDDDGTLFLLAPGVPFKYFDSQQQAVTLKLTGPGQGQVLLPGNGFGNADPKRIKLEGTATASALTITVAAKNSLTRVPILEVVGSLGKLTAPTTQSTQSLSIAGTAKMLVLAGASGVLNIGAPVTVTDKVKLNLGQVRDLSLSSSTPLNSLTALDWQDHDNTPDLITTPWIGSLNVTGRKAKGALEGLAGDFEAGLSLSALAAGIFLAPKLIALGKATVAGSITGSEWNVAGHIGSVTAASLVDSRIALGEDQNDLSPKLNFKALTLKGDKFNASTPSFVRSQVYLTGTLGSAKLNLVDTTQEINNPNDERRLGLRADGMTLVNFRAPNLNGGKLLTLKKLGSLDDLNNPRVNPANVSALTGKFRLMLV